MNVSNEIDPWRAYLVVVTGGELKAIDVRNGQVAWRVVVDEGGGPLDPAPLLDLAILGNRVYVAPRGHKVLHCFDYATGAHVWAAQTTSTFRAQVVADGPQIYVARGGDVDCFGMDGVLRWTAPVTTMRSPQVAFGFAGNIRQVDLTD
jgi:outer membrane protein assembly factor BamB